TRQSRGCRPPRQREDRGWCRGAQGCREARHQFGRRPYARCWPQDRYEQMTAAVAPFDRPNAGFAIKTFHGEFVDAVKEIRQFVGPSFPLIFIDPTGWTKYPFTKIAPLFALSKCEALINFMYGHIS